MDLYALPPEEFTAARDAAAKVDKGLKQLRRPTVAAWVVNTLVRREGGLLDDLVSLGRELGEAQSGRDADALRELGRRRKELVAAVTQRAVALSGRDVTPAVRLEVEQTLEAALADPASGEAVRSGQLTRALQYAGFGGVDLEGAVAPLPPARRSPAPAARTGTGTAKETGKRVAKLEAAALEAQGALDDAVRKAEQVAAQLAAAEHDLATAEQQAEAADAEVEAAQAALERAQRAAGEAASRRTEARRAHDDAERRAQRTTEAVARAQAAAEEARQRLDAARRG